jgi:hypothetical protein
VREKNKKPQQAATANSGSRQQRQTTAADNGSFRVWQCRCLFFMFIAAAAAAAAATATAADSGSTQRVFSFYVCMFFLYFSAAAAAADNSSRQRQHTAKKYTVGFQCWRTRIVAEARTLYTGYSRSKRNS